MRFVSFRAAGGASWGVLRDGAIAPLADRWPDLRTALGAEPGALAAAAADARPGFALAEVELLPPIPAPEKIICVGLNYAAHARELGLPPPPHPPLFARFPDTLVGHGQPVVRPAQSQAFDWEGELAVVIGRGGRSIPAARALSAVAGYSCLMEGSVRDYQNHSSQFTAGKIFWHSGAFGPWLVTADEIPDPARLSLETRVNGRTEQKAATSDLIFGVPQIVAYVSALLPLVPGDVISTGTPAGVGGFRKPPVFLKPGDTVEVEISGLGVLRNPVIDA